MKTIFIDIADNRQELSGFFLSNGYNFRLIDFVQGEKSNKVFVVEAGSKPEEKALKAFIKEVKASVSLVVENGNKAGLKGKKLGIFTEVAKDYPFVGYWLDKSTGKAYAII